MHCTKSSLNICHYAKLTDGLLEATDIDTWFVADTGTGLTGFLDLALFLKTGNYESSMAAFNYTNDWPTIVTRCEGHVLLNDLNPSQFNCDLSMFVPYAAKDEFRAVLQGIYFCARNKEICVTQGHSLLTVKNEAVDRDFILHNRYASMIDLLTVEKAGIGSFENKEYLHLSGEGYALHVKLMEGPYPEYERVIPEGLPWFTHVVSRKTVEEVLHAAGDLTPYANPKTKLIIVEQNKIFVRNRDKSRIIFINTQESFQPKGWTETRIDELFETEIAEEKSYPPVGYNAEFLSVVLKDLLELNADKSFTFLWGKQPINALCVKTTKSTHLVMPLRIIDEADESEVPEEQRVKYEEVELKVEVKPLTPKAPKLDKKLEKAVLNYQSIYGVEKVLSVLNEALAGAANA